MTEKHSPGPWKWEASAGIIVDADGRIVIDVDPGMSCEEADARLIAAAPDLLAALRDIVIETSGKAIPNESLTACRNRALAAIANAEDA